jgi:hypothetical protein
MSWILVLVLYSYSNGDIGSSTRPSTMSTETTVIDMPSEKVCQRERIKLANKLKLPRQDRMETSVRVTAVCVDRDS